MSDLSQTILEGTGQMSQASQALAKAVAGRTERRQVALENMTRSFQDATKTYQAERTWQNAKAGETEEAAVNNAVALARTQGGPDKVSIAVSPVPTKTARGSTAKVNAIKMADLETRENTQNEFTKAQTFKLNQDQIDKNQEMKDVQAAVKKSPLKHAGLNEYFSQGHGSMDDYFKASHDEMLEEKQTQKDAAAAQRQEQLNAFKKQMTEYMATQRGERQKVGIDAKKDAAQKKWDLNLPFIQKAIELHEQAAQRADAYLNIHATHEQNAYKLDQFRATLQGLAANNKTILEKDKAAYGRVRDELVTGLQTAKFIEDTVSKEWWEAPDKENKALLLEKARGTRAAIENEFKLFKSYKEPPELQEAPQAPVLKDPATSGPSGAPQGGPRAGRPQDPKFDAWMAQNALQGDTGFDYDYQAAYQAGENRQGPDGHLSDRFKKPWHESFSKDSDLSQKYPDLAGTWDQQGQYQETQVHKYMMTLDDKHKQMFTDLTPEQRTKVLEQVSK